LFRKLFKVNFTSLELRWPVQSFIDFSVVQILVQLVSIVLLISWSCKHFFIDLNFFWLVNILILSWIAEEIIERERLTLSVLNFNFLLLNLLFFNLWEDALSLALRLDNTAVVHKHL
jgi:hypothetical protein